MYNALVSVICLLATSVHAWGTEGSRAENFDHSYRLPDAITPVVYDLRLTLDSRSDVITGQVRIEMQCTNSTRHIELSANPLFIDVKHTLLENRLSNETIDLGEPIVHWDTYTVEYHLAEQLIQGHVYHLSIWFRTKFSDDGRGLSRYFDKERGTWLNSLFEPYHARRLLPCFDEPRWRSVLKLQLWLMNDFANKRNRNYTALSNTGGERKIWNEMLTIWTFKPTPPIPTYLFTVALGHLRSVCKTFVREICIWRFAHWQGWEDTAQLIIQDIHEYQ
ncbi:Peptidase M1, partial [Aphelenchoides avenae]